MSWAALERWLAAQPGEYSVCVVRDGAQVYGYREHVPRSAASLIKVPLALAVLDAGLDLEQRVLLREADRVAGCGSLDAAPAGTLATLRQLIVHALVESDNTAANLLIARLGMPAVNRWLAEHGLTQTRLRRRFMDLDALRAGCDNTTSAAEMCAILALLLDPRRCWLLELLRQVADDDKLGAGLPPGTPLAHKVGDLPGVEHDAGIVWTPGGPLIMAALACALPDAATGRAAIRHIARVVWRQITVDAGPTRQGAAHEPASGAWSDGHCAG
ncbi:serine hydrolase [Kallotenue papyrolyticum]|uniref:serine hydrolase n=1 Tax=Kallotenue papyrolyticum TaxID=1325125 RepID=UPI00047862D9|nr:serine hydrolase [Kallotenue papyrolyticum]